MLELVNSLGVTAGMQDDDLALHRDEGHREGLALDRTRQANHRDVGAQDVRVVDGAGVEDAAAADPLGRVIADPREGHPGALAARVGTARGLGQAVARGDRDVGRDQARGAALEAAHLAPYEHADGLGAARLGAAQVHLAREHAGVSGLGHLDPRGQRRRAHRGPGRRRRAGGEEQGGCGGRAHEASMTTDRRIGSRSLPRCEGPPIGACRTA
ncbi:MAG: hypothetical protein R3B82_12985 [Sandaracinaceae bacterium]